MNRHIMQSRPHIPKSPSGVERIVSGGQTGADRAGLDVAIRHGLLHGGWCPKGRRAETGRVPARYRLKETPRTTYIQRTEWNVRDSDGTAIFTIRPDLRAGSRRTQEFARKYEKPNIHIPLSSTYQPALDLLKFITAHKNPDPQRRRFPRKPGARHRLVGGRRPGGCSILEQPRHSVEWTRRGVILAEPRRC